MASSPKTQQPFDKLLTALVAVPKDEVAALEKAAKAKKRRAAKKKPKLD